LTTYHVRAGDTVIVDPEPVTPPPPPPPAPDPFTVSDAAFSAAMVAEVNKRRAAGWTGKLADGTASTLPPVGPLLADPDLFKAAVASVTDSAQTRTSVHKDWISPNVGTRTHTASGEVIGQDKGYPEATTFFVDAWMRSDGHRAILMNGRYDSGGFAYSRLGDDQVYFAGEFADFSAIPTPPPPVITPTPTTTPFLGFPTSPALAKSGGGLEIKNLSFRGGGVALVISNAASPYIHDCDFADAVGAIFLLNCTNVRVERCRFRNIGDGTIGSGHSNYVQLNNCHGGAIRANKAIGGNTEDKISVYKSGGNSATDPLIVEDNELDGLNANTADAKAWTRGSGTGIILGDGSVGDYIVVRNNTLLRPGQVGIQIIGGIGHQVYGNVLYADPRSPLTDNNVGMSSYAGSPQADVHNNRVYWRKNSGVENSHWWGAGTITDHPSSADPLRNNWSDHSITPASLEVVL
jgi:uncharacterized protein YkwD